MQVFSIFANNRLRNNQYIVKSNTCNIIIDPFNGEQIAEFIKKAQMQKLILLNTHEHYDHRKGNPEVLALGAEFIENKLLSDQNINLGEYDLKAIYTPGHTLSSFSYMIISKETSICEHIILGDTLFHLGVGNCYNGGDSKVLAETLLELDKVLNPQTYLHLGHDYFEANLNFSLKYFELPCGFKKNEKEQQQYMTWQEQKQVNPFLRVLFDRDFRKKYYEDQDCIEAFMNMRDLRDKF